MNNMREIKYRAKVKEKGLDNFWEYGGIIHITEKYKDEEDFEECDIWQLINESGVGFNIDKDTIGQFTGLYDKNGKEIYEGDIVKFKMYDGEYENYKIVFRNAEFEAINEDDTNFISTDIWNVYGEVIGNIYNNHELLEE